jgi:hypothetical protein
VRDVCGSCSCRASDHSCEPAAASSPCVACSRCTHFSLGCERRCRRPGVLALVPLSGLSCKERVPFIKKITPRAPTVENQTRGSRLGSLYYDKITTLATLPSGGRPRHSRRRPCGGAAGSRRSNVATRSGGGATQAAALSTRHPVYYCSTYYRVLKF